MSPEWLRPPRRAQSGRALGQRWSELRRTTANAKFPRAGGDFPSLFEEEALTLGRGQPCPDLRMSARPPLRRALPRFPQRGLARADTRRGSDAFWLQASRRCSRILTLVEFRRAPLEAGHQESVAFSVSLSMTLSTAELAPATTPTVLPCAMRGGDQVGGSSALLPVPGGPLMTRSGEERGANRVALDRCWRGRA